MPCWSDNPKQVGADRIADAGGGLRALRRPDDRGRLRDGPHFEVISAKGEYLGAVLVPWDGTVPSTPDGRRRLCSPGSTWCLPVASWQKHSVESLQSGLIFASVAPRRRTVRAASNPRVGAATVVATGGLPSRCFPVEQGVDYHEPLAPLYGLRTIYQRNRAMAEDFSVPVRADGGGGRVAGRFAAWSPGRASGQVQDRGPAGSPSAEWGS